MPGTGKGLVRRGMGLFYASVGCGGPLIAVGCQFRQQARQTIGRFVAQPAHRLGNIEPGWLQGRIESVREREIVIFGIVFPECRTRPLGIPMSQIGIRVFIGAVKRQDELLFRAAGK